MREVGGGAKSKAGRWSARRKYGRRMGKGGGETRGKA